MRTVRALAAATVIAALAGGLSGCGSDARPDADTPVKIEVTFKDGAVSPVGERVDVGVGQEVDFVVTADEPGEIHVHSDPEQELSYGTGTETLTVKVGRPGLVAVESHDLDQVIVQLAVK